MKRSIKPIATTLALLALCTLANAQKLPNIQQKSLRAPANVKIDGKPTEWDDTFQAYNHATDISYSMANDDKNLYLVVQAKDRAIINKIIGGGVQLTIQKSGKKDDQNGVTVTYPMFDAKTRPYVRGGGGTMGAKMVAFGSSSGGIQTMDVVKDDGGGKAAPAADMEGDSIMNVYNQRLDQNSKNIMVTGIAGLDTLISVYNEDGIKAGERFNTKMVYTVELAIDLKKLGLSASDASKFAYHIKLNGAPMGVMNMVINGKSTTSADPAMQQKIQELMSQMHVSAPGGDPTDFWAEYTLAKN